jgi:hypothetical protein
LINNLKGLGLDVELLKEGEDRDTYTASPEMPTDMPMESENN